MSVVIEYFLADATSRSKGSLSQNDAISAVQNFPWEEQLALFNQGDDNVGPEVRFLNSVQAYASIAKVEDGTWLIVAGSTMPGKILGIFPTTKKTDIILDNLSWKDVQGFIKRFYESSRAELFAWIKERE